MDEINMNEIMLPVKCFNIYQGGEKGTVPLFFCSLTSVTPINRDFSFSNLNTCQISSVMEKFIEQVSECIIRISEFTGISQKVIRNFIDVLQHDKKTPVDLLTEYLGKDFSVKYMNFIGYGDKDFSGVSWDNKTNILYLFAEDAGSDMSVWGENYSCRDDKSLKTILHPSDSQETINLAINFREFLNQGEKKFELEDFKFPTDKNFLQKCSNTKKQGKWLTIYDENGELNELGQLVYEKLCEELSTRVSKEKISAHLKNYVKLTLSAVDYSFEELPDYLDDVIDALIFKLNEDKYFPEEIYKPIKITNNILDDSFASTHYFQCIVTACMMHFLNAEANVRASIIDKIIKVRDNFENMEDFAASEYRRNLSPDDKVKFMIKKFCGDEISENDLTEILNTTTNIYADLFSNGARLAAATKTYHTTQFIFLPCEGLFVDGTGVVRVPFPRLYKIVTGEDLELSAETMDAYDNFDKSNPKDFVYEVSINKMNAREINLAPTKDLVQYISHINKEQLHLLSSNKICECIKYVKNQANNCDEEKKKKVSNLILCYRGNEIVTNISFEDFYWCLAFVDIDELLLTEQRISQLTAEQVYACIEYIKNANKFSQDVKQLYLERMSYKKLQYLSDMPIDTFNYWFQHMDSEIFIHNSKFLLNRLTREQMCACLEFLLNSSDYSDKEKKEIFKIVLSLSQEKTDDMPIHILTSLFLFIDKAPLDRIEKRISECIEYVQGSDNKFSKDEKKRILSKIKIFEKESNKLVDLLSTIVGVAFTVIATAMAILTFGISLIPFGIGLGLLIGSAVLGLLGFVAKCILNRHVFKINRLIRAITKNNHYVQEQKKSDQEHEESKEIILDQRQEEVEEFPLMSANPLPQQQGKF